MPVWAVAVPVGGSSLGLAQPPVRHPRPLRPPTRRLSPFQLGDLFGFVAEDRLPTPAKCSSAWPFQTASSTTRGWERTGFCRTCAAGASSASSGYRLSAVEHRRRTDFHRQVGPERPHRDGPGGDTAVEPGFSHDPDHRFGPGRPAARRAAERLPPPAEPTRVSRIRASRAGAGSRSSLGARYLRGRLADRLGLGNRPPVPHRAPPAGREALADCGNAVLPSDFRREVRIGFSPDSRYLLSWRARTAPGSSIPASGGLRWLASPGRPCGRGVPGGGRLAALASRDGSVGCAGHRAVICTAPICSEDIHRAAAFLGTIDGQLLLGLDGRLLRIEARGALMRSQRA